MRSSALFALDLKIIDIRFITLIARGRPFVLRVGLSFTLRF
ncbi:hypothetical protein [Actinocorallia herbida]|nr:hypothetical protein [Actinocorallia herbida]